MKNKHYTEKDFIVTIRTDRAEYGFCKVCGCNMQRFRSDNFLRHYKTHGYKNSSKS
jgi:hypothetical protein